MKKCIVLGILLLNLCFSMNVFGMEKQLRRYEPEVESSRHQKSQDERNEELLASLSDLNESIELFSSGPWYFQQAIDSFYIQLGAFETKNLDHRVQVRLSDVIHNALRAAKELTDCDKTALYIKLSKHPLTPLKAIVRLAKDTVDLVQYLEELAKAKRIPEDDKEYFPHAIQQIFENLQNSSAWANDRSGNDGIEFLELIAKLSGHLDKPGAWLFDKKFVEMLKIQFLLFHPSLAQGTEDQEVYEKLRMSAKFKD